MFRGTLLVVALTLGAGYARAQPRCDVLLVAPGADTPEPFLGRLRAELAASALSTQNGPASSAPLDELARQSACLSAVRGLPSGKGVELWLDETANGRPLVRNLVVDERAGGPDVAMVVLQTTELLRAGLQGTTLTPAVSARPQIERAVPQVSDTRHAFSLGAGAGLLKQRGGFPMVPVMRVEAAWHVWRGVGPELLLQGPWQTTDLRTTEGSTRATPWAVAVGVRLNHSFERLFGEVGVGLLWQIWHVEGLANSAVNVQAQTFSELGVYTRARAGVYILPWLRCGVEAVGSANVSETRIVHAQRDVGAVGRLGGATFFVIEALTL